VTLARRGSCLHWWTKGPGLERFRGTVLKDQSSIGFWHCEPPGDRDPLIKLLNRLLLPAVVRSPEDEAPHEGAPGGDGSGLCPLAYGSALVPRGNGMFEGVEGDFWGMRRKFPTWKQQEVKS
jgi:hypothetical protein